ncbi:MAG: restriction endonuclease, SacI family [Syntrophales bacterium]|nr:restriction endonuclease, SacI family [Syntrophales bacterium]
MARKKSEINSLDLNRAAELLEKNWQLVTGEASAKPEIQFISDEDLRHAIGSSIGHKQVAFRFCLPVQILGKLTNPKLDSLRLQKRKGDLSDITGWDARSLASKVVAPFNRRQENIIGTCLRASVWKKHFRLPTNSCQKSREVTEAWRFAVLSLMP